MTTKQMIKTQLERVGIKMIKKISSGGFFSSDTYDVRKVYSFKELFRLTREGFKVEGDMGIFLLNAFIKDL